jgi:hypothetical protein
LEAQNTAPTDAPLPRLPRRLAPPQALREQVAAALQQVMAEDGPRRVNLTDADAQLMKSRQGFVAGYNAQAMVSPLAPAPAGRTGLLITAADVVTAPDDQGQLLPMIEQAAALTGQPAERTLVDGGYHSGDTVAECAARGLVVILAEAEQANLAHPYHKDHFVHDEAADTSTCPAGQVLRFVGVKERTGRPPVRVYRGEVATCRGCPAFGRCTKDRRQGRALEIGPQEAARRRHRAWMATAEAQTAYRQRKQLPEPTVGILKEQQGARRFLLRGLAAVQAEWHLLATTFNLRTLARVWPGARPELRLALTRGCGG